MEEMPPNTLKSKLVHLDHSLKDIERKRFAGIQRAPGSLPVLEAFQDFLDAERAKARKQLTLLTVVFVLLLILITAGGGAFVYFQMQQSATDYSALSDKTEKLEQELSKAQEQVDGTLKEVQSQLEKTVAGQTALLGVQSNVSARVSGTAKTVADLQEKLKNLRKENQALRSQLDKVDKNSAAAASKIKDLEKWQKALARRILNQEKERTESSSVPPNTTVATGRSATAAKQPAGTRQRKPVKGKAAKAAQKPTGASPPAAVVAHSKASPPTTGRKQPKRQAAVSPDPSVINLTIKPAGSAMGIRWRLPRVSPE